MDLINIKHGAPSTNWLLASRSTKQADARSHMNQAHHVSKDTKMQLLHVTKHRTPSFWFKKKKRQEEKSCIFNDVLWQKLKNDTPTEINSSDERCDDTQ